MRKYADEGAVGRRGGEGEPRGEEEARRDTLDEVCMKKFLQKFSLFFMWKKRLSLSLENCTAR